MHGRDAALARVIERMAVVTRDMAARGSHPFRHLGLGRAAMTALFLLARRDRLRVAELAEHLGVTSGAVTQTVERLKAAELVTSEVDGDDRRARVICLTARARDEISAFEQQYIAAVSPAFDAVSTADIHALDRILACVRLPVEGTDSARGSLAG